LSASRISIDLPDIGASLAAVRNYRLTRENDSRAAFEGRPMQAQKQPTKQSKGTAR
jgi:uncharacterized protein HemX